MSVRLRPNGASAGQVRVRPDGASAGQATEITRPAALLVTGRVVGFVASFAIGIVLARIFAPAVFGTYKQFFLLYGTLYGLAQFGMAESLYYFVPRNSARTPRYVCNALITLAVAGLGCMGALYMWRSHIAEWLTNPALADDMALAHVLADTADSIAMSRFRAQDLRVSEKPDLTPVTDADTAVEKALRATLARTKSSSVIEVFSCDIAGTATNSAPRQRGKTRFLFMVSPLKQIEIEVGRRS